ncbi:hypothetical protein ACGFMK_09145 [Amycolatopsis sp. NPDC049252]|uniref:hypothetical protein n=1 Tax=Amycolatopsis sp. NPDC049252 TaxID=3363933 RepID=UPI003711DAD8
MSKSKRSTGSSRPRATAGSRLSEPARAGGEPSWPSTFARGAIYALGKAAVEWVIDIATSNDS